MTLAQVLGGIAAGLGIVALGGLARAATRPRLPVLVVGDSLAVGLGQALLRRFPRQVRIAAQVGEAPAVTLARMPGRVAAHPEARTIVVWSGANRINEPGVAVSQVALAVEDAAASGRKVLVLELPEVPRLGEDGRLFNTGLGYATARHASVVAVPRGAEVAGDGLHLTAAGYDAVAEAVARRF